MPATARSTEGLAAAAPVPQAVFNVDGVAVRERFDFWRDSISCVFDVEPHADARDRKVYQDGFHAEISASMLGPVMLARTRTRRQDWIRSPSVMARDGMDHYMVQLYERGSMAWETGSGSHAYPARGLVVFDLARPVRTTTTDFANLSLIIPRGMLEGALASASDQHMRVLSGEEPMVRLLRDHMLSLKRLSGRMTSRQASEIAPATVGLTAACLNATLADDKSQQDGYAIARMATIRRLIEENLSEPDLSVDWIVRRAGVPRTRLYEMFDVFDGVANYIRERRLRHALLTLAGNGGRRRSIYDIALDCGYSSDTAFAKAFRKRYGVKPTDVRQAGMTEQTATGPATGIDRRYENWLYYLSI